MNKRYTVVIAERNEPDLKATVSDIRANSALADVVVISDKTGRGPQACRHYGITQAKTDIVIIVDGHMRFAPGSLDKMAAAALPGDVVGCALCHHNADLSFEDSPYAGARWAWKSEDRGQYFVLTGKWRDRADLGAIPCVMGACYSFSRAWYEKIGSPWRLGRGWGLDEETLSLATWLMGGRCEQVAAEVAHQYRIQSTLPYRLSAAQSAGVWANRITFLEMLPLPDQDRDELTAWLHQNGALRGPAGVAVRNMVDHVATAAIRETLAAGPRTFAEWKTTFITQTEGEPQMRKELLDRAKRAGIDGAKMTNAEIKKALAEPDAGKVAEMVAGAGATMERPPAGFLGTLGTPAKKKRGRPRKTTTTATTPATPPPARAERIPNRITADLGAPCVHCGHRYDHKITNTFPNGNRRRVCGKCGRPFITREIPPGE